MKETFIQQHLNGAELDTPQKILLAALVEFGNAPVKNVGTRDIARRAGVNIAAISYYFKGKDGLYAELIDQIVSYFRKSASEFYRRFDALGDAPERRAAAKLLRDYVSWRIMSVSELDDELFKSIISIFVREELNNTAHFKKIYAKLVSRTDALLQKLLETVLGGAAGGDTVKIMSIALVGALIRFNTASESLKMTMGWRAITERDRAKIKDAFLFMLDKILA